MRHSRANYGDRSNALWGRGSRGESRSNALWGRGGRRAGAAVAMVAVFAMASVAAAGITSKNDKGGGKYDLKAYVSPDLLSAIQQNPSQTFDVIVQGDKKGTSRGFYKQLTGDNYGTFVSSIAAGSAPQYAGAAPKANILSLDVMNDQGQATVSDVIKAADWILANKAQYNIKVANFSLHAVNKASILFDPLDAAVEKLWLNGVTVVPPAGNYGSPNGPSAVRFAPGTDPSVIAVAGTTSATTLGPTDYSA